MSSQLREFSREFRAMGTDVAFWLWHKDEQRAERALAYAERFFHQTEARLSRFRPSSELSRLNRQAGRPLHASPMLYEVVKSALVWRTRTSGVFDPTILNALLAAGYDRSFDSLAFGADVQNLAHADQLPLPAAKPTGGPAADEIRLGPGLQIHLPAGVGIDLGGIAKGWAIQQAVYRLGALGPALVDGGGDVACVGSPPDGPWTVSVADPLAPEQDIAYLPLSNRAVATSSRARRRWLHNGQSAHHLIDPRTGAPAETNILSATVIAPRLPDAEIHAKTALILGEQVGLAYLNRLSDISALLVMADGSRRTSGSFKEDGYVPHASNFAERLRIPA